MSLVRLLFTAAALVAVPGYAAFSQAIVPVHGLKPGDCVLFQNWNGTQTGTVTEGEIGGGYHVNWNGVVIPVGANSRDIKLCPAAAKPAPGAQAQPGTPAAALPAPGAHPAAAGRPVNNAAAAAPGQPTFNVNGLATGTCVQFSYGGGWETATIAGPEYAGGYPVNWGSIKTTVPANTRDLRACPAGTADPQAASAAALSRLPKGSGVGAQFGTRNPVTCPNRKIAITAATARQLVACDAEFVLGDSLHLVTDLSVQVGSARPFNPLQDSAETAIDARQPVYDLKGSYTIYQCTPVASGQTPFAQTHNCNKYPATAGGYGECYTDTLGNKRCIMTGGGPTQIRDQAPPAQ